MQEEEHLDQNVWKAVETLGTASASEVIAHLRLPDTPAQRETVRVALFQLYFSCMLRRIGIGVYAVVDKKEELEGRKSRRMAMWKMLRMRNRMTLDDLQELTDMNRDEALTWCRIQVRNGLVQDPCAPDANAASASYAPVPARGSASIKRLKQDMLRHIQRAEQLLEAYRVLLESPAPSLPLPTVPKPPPDPALAAEAIYAQQTKILYRAMALSGRPYEVHKTFWKPLIHRVSGTESAIDISELTLGQRHRMIAHFSLPDTENPEVPLHLNHWKKNSETGSTQAYSNGATHTRQACMEKIEAILADMKHPRSYVDSMAQQYYGVDKVEDLSYANLIRIMQALYHQNRRRKKETQGVTDPALQ